MELAACLTRCTPAGPTPLGLAAEASPGCGLHDAASPCAVVAALPVHAAWLKLSSWGGEEPGGGAEEQEETPVQPWALAAQLMEMAGQVQADLYGGWMGAVLPGSTREAVQQAALTRMAAQHVRAVLRARQQQDSSLVREFLDGLVTCFSRINKQLWSITQLPICRCLYRPSPAHSHVMQGVGMVGWQSMSCSFAHYGPPA